MFVADAVGVLFSSLTVFVLQLPGCFGWRGTVPGGVQEGGCNMPLHIYTHIYTQLEHLFCCYCSLRKKCLLLRPAWPSSLFCLIQPPDAAANAGYYRPNI
jgi:hypothetical protein